MTNNIENKICISVITVCLNAELSIEDTIFSVLNQRYDNYEYIIKDGLSSDKTVELAERYRYLFIDKGIKFSVISEKDYGIYDAMNKAASYANGEWVIFINSGDTLLNDSTLNKLSGYMCDSYDVLYGDVYFHENKFYKLMKAGNLNEFSKQNPIFHQASITRTQVVRAYGFDVRYKLAADFDLFLRIYNDSPDRIKKIELPVSTYLLGGVSSTSIVLRESELNISRRNNGEKIRIPLCFSIVRCYIIEFLRILAKKIFKTRFYSKRRGWSLETTLY